MGFFKDSLFQGTFSHDWAVLLKIKEQTDLQIKAKKKLFKTFGISQGKPNINKLWHREPCLVRTSNKNHHYITLPVTLNRVLHFVHQHFMQIPKFTIQEKTSRVVLIANSTYFTSNWNIFYIIKCTSFIVWKMRELRIWNLIAMCSECDDNYCKCLKY